MVSEAQLHPQVNLSGRAGPPRSSGIVVGVLAAAGIVVSLAQTLVVPILGSLPQIFHTAAANTSWIVTVTLLSGAVFTPVLGRLADMYGKKRILLVAIVPFIIGSALCAVSTSVAVMVWGRGLQGIAGGMVPLGVSLLPEVVPAGKVGRSIALMSSSMGIGGALGLPIAAAVAEFADWRVLFWATAGAALLVAVMIWRLIPDGHSRAEGSFDVTGALGLSVGLVALLLGISRGSSWGWASAATVGCLGCAAVVLVLWGVHEAHRRDPLIDLRTTARPVVLLTNIASLLVGFSMYAMNLILPQVMQLPVEIGYGLGQTMFQMGLWLAPMGIGMMAVSPLGAALSHRRGPKVTLTIACIVNAVGYGLAAAILATIGGRDTGPASAGLIICTLVLLAASATMVGCGTGLAYGAMPALIMGAVPTHLRAASNGFNALMRSLGTTTSAAVVGVVLASMSQQLSGHTIPTQAGFLVALLIGCAVSLVASGTSATIPAKK